MQENNSNPKILFWAAPSCRCNNARYPVLRIQASRGLQTVISVVFGLDHTLRDDLNVFLSRKLECFGDMGLAAAADDMFLTPSHDIDGVPDDETLVLNLLYGDPYLFDEDVAKELFSSLCICLRNPPIGKVVAVANSPEELLPSIPTLAHAC